MSTPTDTLLAILEDDQQYGAFVASLPAKIDPGYYCDHCTSPGDCDMGGCAYDNAESSDQL